VVGFAGGFYARSVFVSPAAPAWPIVPPIATLTPFGWAPGFLEPGWGVGPGWGWFAPPPVVVMPPRIVLAGGAVERKVNDGNPALAFEELPKPIEPLPQGARRDQFIVISPKRAFPAAGRMTPEVDRVASVPPPRPPAFRFDPFARPVIVEAERRETDPAKEAARLLALGRAAFAAGHYGKAAEHFERASAVDAKLAPPYFLKGQAAIAAGRYADAVSAIRAGLELDPNWPAGTFDPKEPYGANAVAFADHLAQLRKAIAANPGEPALEFLLGCQLWFVGEKIEARRWFDAAARRPGAAGLAARFK
jgi:tetratricopeptide (TPR) repeat protein